MTTGAIYVALRRLTGLFLAVLLSGCTGLAWNTTVADHPPVRRAMLESVHLNRTTETDLIARWGRPTQKIRQGAQTQYVYRNMSNPPGHHFPQFGDSRSYVVVVFQYGLAVGAYSSDTEGCRATFAPRPPGVGFDNPSTVKPVNCGLPPGADAGRDGGLLGALGMTGAAGKATDGLVPGDPGGQTGGRPGVPPDHYSAGGGKY